MQGCEWGVSLLCVGWHLFLKVCVVTNNESVHTGHGGEGWGVEGVGAVSRGVVHLCSVALLWLSGS